MSVILNVSNYFAKLGFYEERPDVYVKVYGENLIELHVDREVIDYGQAVGNGAAVNFSQLNFVVLECVDRLLRNGVAPAGIRVGNSEGVCEVLVHEHWEDVQCWIWEDVFLHDARPDSFGEGRKPALYTSRLKAGIIEHWVDGDSAVVSLFGRTDLPSGTAVDQDGDMVVRAGALVAFGGTSAESAVVPPGVLKLGNGVFWRHEELRRVVVPEGIRSLGGDTFYSCTNLEEFTIPASVEQIGDNPFANCPKLRLRNDSPHFALEDGLLWERATRRLVHVQILGRGPELAIPDGVSAIGKHAFYKCQQLRRVVIPPSVKIVENNPFSDMPDLRLENRSPHLVFRDGALYNKTMGTLCYYEAARDADALRVPEGVRTIGRHAFFNCRRLKHLVLPSTLERIGYNPFAGCSSLHVESLSPAFVVHEGALFDRAMKELIFYPAAKTDSAFVVPATVRKIGRSAFFGNPHLRQVVLPDGLATIERSAFAYCVRLVDVVLPSTVRSIGDWAFEGCPAQGSAS